MVLENCEIKAGGLDWTRPQVRVLRGPSPSQVRVQRGPSPSRVRVHKKVDSSPDSSPSPDSSTPTLLVRDKKHNNTVKSVKKNANGAVDRKVTLSTSMLGS